MLNERQLKIVDLLEQQPRTPGELAQQTGVSGRTILRDIDYLNFTLNGKARIFASGSAGYQLEIFERRSFFQLSCSTSALPTGKVSSESVSGTPRPAPRG